MYEFIKEYIRGCATCQENKILTRRNKPALYPIPPEEDAKPFQTVAMDLIVKLPTSNGYDSILTIMDHNCTKGVILIPCRETMNTEELAREYKDRVFPFVGIPSKIISDRDTRFTGNFAKEVCTQLEIQQNISTTYHPQMDGQSEKTNQYVEMALRIFCNFQQSNWADFIPMVQYMLNVRPAETTKKVPFELWMGYIPHTHQPERPSEVPRVEWYERRFQEARKQAQEAMKRAQGLWIKETKFQPYQKDDQVWLDAKNLKTTHPTSKLRPLRYGPLRVTEVISLVVYRLELPHQWRIHNAFHASLLSPYKETEAHGPNFPGQIPDIVEGQEEWEVKKVLDSRRRGHKKQLQYLLKWKGYPKAENTWEDKENVFAQELLEEFHLQHPKAIRAIRVQKEDSEIPNNVVLSTSLHPLLSSTSQGHSLAMSRNATSAPSSPATG